MGQVLPFHWMPKSAKAFGFRGALPPDPLTRGSAPGPRWGHRPQTPRYRLALPRSPCIWAVPLFITFRRLCAWRFTSACPTLKFIPYI